MPNQRTRKKRQAREGLANLIAEPLTDSDKLRTGKGHNPDVPETSKPKPDPVPETKPDPTPGLDRPILDPPAGFKSKADFEAFRDRLNQGLRDAGYDDAKVMLQGSATDGVSHNPDKGSRPFDGGGKPSDYDLTVKSDKLVDAAKANGIDLRNRGERTGPIERAKDLDKVGLRDLHKELTEMTGGRPMSFMAYRDAQFAVDRARSPTISLSPPYGYMPKTR